MSWVRCRRCRTVGDRERGTSCAGCGQPFHDASAAAAAPEVLRIARRDLSWSTAAVRVLAVVCIAGVLFVVSAPGASQDRRAHATVSFLLFFPATLLFVLLIGKGLRRLRLHPIVALLLGLAGVMAALFGAGLLVVGACSAGGLI